MCDTQHMQCNSSLSDGWLTVYASAIVTSTSTPGSMLMDVWIVMLMNPTHALNMNIDVQKLTVLTVVNITIVNKVNILHINNLKQE